MVNKPDSAQTGVQDYQSAIGPGVKGEETGTNGWESRCGMRDLLFVLIYLAMVVTPAVVAVRSGRETGTDE